MLMQPFGQSSLTQEQQHMLTQNKLKALRLKNGHLVLQRVETSKALAALKKRVKDPSPPVALEEAPGPPPQSSHLNLFDEAEVASPPLAQSDEELESFPLPPEEDPMPGSSTQPDDVVRHCAVPWYPAAVSLSDSD